MSQIIEGQPVPWEEYARVQHQVGDLTLACGILVQKELDRLNKEGEEAGDPGQPLTEVMVSRLEGRDFHPGGYYLEIVKIADKMIFKIGKHENAPQT